MGFCMKCGQEIAGEGTVCAACASAEPAAQPVMQPVPQVQLNRGKNNAFAWIMALIPLVGTIVGWILGFGYVTLVLNIIFGYIDEKSLREQGVDTTKFGKMAWLVPYYLFKRANILGEKPIYAIVWCVLFAITLV